MGVTVNSRFNDTVELERAFIKAVLSSAIMARMYLHQAKEDMFTSDQRQTIFSLAELVMNESGCLLTKQVFEYELRARFEEDHIANCLCEWNLIDSVTSFDMPEALLAKMKEANVGRKTLQVSEEVVNLLQQGNIKDAVAFLKREAMMITSGSKDDRPITNLTDIKARLTLIRDKQQHPEKYQGLKIGLKTFDDQTGGLFPGELTLIAGITGLGKSTLCRTIAKGIVTLNGAKNVLHVGNEEYLEQIQYKYDALFSNIPYQDFKFAKITEEDLDRWQNMMQKEMTAAGRGQVFIKEVPAFTDVSLVEKEFRMLENRGIPIHAIIIDHLPHVKPIQQAWGENDERAKAAADCKELARQLRVPVVTPTQAATEVEKKQTRGQRASKMDVYGSKGQVHVANTFMIITYKGTDNTQVDLPDYLRDVFWLCDAKKNRDGAPFYFMAKHAVKTGTVVEIDDPTKKASKEEDEAINDAEKESKPQTIPETPVTKNVSPVLETGVRDDSVAFAEALDEKDEKEEDKDGQQEGVDTESVISGLESQEVDNLLAEAGLANNEPTVMSAKDVIEKGKRELAEEAGKRKDGILSQLRSSKSI